MNEEFSSDWAGPRVQRRMDIKRLPEHRGGPTYPLPNPILAKAVVNCSFIEAISLTICNTRRVVIVQN